MLDFETIKKYYDKALWTADMVGKAVEKGKLTAEEHRAIVGNQYSKEG